MRCESRQRTRSALTRARCGYAPRRSRKLTHGYSLGTDPASARMLLGVGPGQKRCGRAATIPMRELGTERKLEERGAGCYLLLRFAVLLDVVEFVTGVEARAGSRSEGPLMRTVMQWCCNRSSSASTSGLFWNSAYQSG